MTDHIAGYKLQWELEKEMTFTRGHKVVFVVFLVNWCLNLLLYLLSQNLYCPPVLPEWDLKNQCLVLRTDYVKVQSRLPWKNSRLSHLKGLTIPQLTLSLMVKPSDQESIKLGKTRGNVSSTLLLFPSRWKEHSWSHTYDLLLPLPSLKAGEMQWFMWLARGRQINVVIKLQTHTEEAQGQAPDLSCS